MSSDGNYIGHKCNDPFNCNKTYADHDDNNYDIICKGRVGESC